MRSMEVGSADCVFIDPPYSSGGVLESQKQSAGKQGVRSDSESAARFKWFEGNNMTTAGISYLLREIAIEADRVLKPGSSFLVFCDWRILISFVPAIESAGLHYKNIIVWDKINMGLGNGFRHQHELIVHFTKGKQGNYYSKKAGNVISCKRQKKADKIHDSEKPIKLLIEVLNVVTKPGDLVVDCFAGSGSLGEACLISGRRFYGADKSEHHGGNAIARLEKNAYKYDLFNNNK